nr:hypothetical protein [Bacteroides intestinalis]
MKTSCIFDPHYYYHAVATSQQNIGWDYYKKHNDIVRTTQAYKLFTQTSALSF